MTQNRFGDRNLRGLSPNQVSSHRQIFVSSQVLGDIREIIENLRNGFTMATMWPPNNCINILTIGVQAINT